MDARLENLEVNVHWFIKLPVLLEAEKLADPCPVHGTIVGNYPSYNAAPQSRKNPDGQKTPSLEHCVRIY